MLLLASNEHRNRSLDEKLWQMPKNKKRQMRKYNLYKPFISMLRTKSEDPYELVKTSKNNAIQQKAHTVCD
jgi:hypothetical protein